jgi:NADPH-dependent 2,4-dienoyl-CoA reductase/sulfur reductase-like enzyme
VVGGSLASLRAAQAARRAGFDGPLTMICGEQHLPYDRPPLSKDYLDAADHEPTTPTFRTRTNSARNSTWT